MLPNPTGKRVIILAGPERGAWRKRHMVDVAVQGLVHSEHEPSHTSSFSRAAIRAI